MLPRGVAERRPRRVHGRVRTRLRRDRDVAGRLVRVERPPEGLRHVIERVELLHVAIPLVTPFRTSFGTMTTKDTFLLRVVTDAAEGWSEFAADPEPLYCSEFVAGAELVLKDHLVPRVTPEITAAEVGPRTPRSRATSWPRPPWRPRSSTPSCGRTGCRSARTWAR